MNKRIDWNRIANPVVRDQKRKIAHRMIRKGYRVTLEEYNGKVCVVGRKGGDSPSVWME
jgi:hypothetical protein